MMPTTFTFRFKKIIRKYGLPDYLNVHNLRYSNAGLLGPAQARTTPDIYSHAFDKTKKEAGEKLAGVF